MLTTRTSALLSPLLLALAGSCAVSPDETVGDTQQSVANQMPNNQPLPDDTGCSASFHTAGFVALDGNFFTPQGTNGRDCASCHVPEDGWSIRPATVVAMFNATNGLDPIFVNNLDTDTPTSDMSTVEARWNATTMLRQGKFTRKVSPPAVRDYTVIGASDPFGVGTTSSLWFFRRPLPTANFRSFTVMWDSANTVGTSLRDGLIKQARSNVTGAQQGAPAPDAIIFDIVDFELALSNTQLVVNGVGRLDVDGAHGGPAAADMLSFNGGYGAQVYAGAGYMVLMPNYRASTQYGDKFKTETAGDYFTKGYQDIMTGVDNLIAKGMVDSTQMGALGWSAGGHYSDWILTHTNRFKAISSGAGVANWISMWSQSDTQRLRQWYVGDKMYWDTPTEYQNWWKQSPIATVKNAKTPIFIHVVDGDPRVPRPQSEEMHMALSKLGVPNEFWVYPGNTHGIPDVRNQYLKAVAEMSWMDYYVRGSGKKFAWRDVLKSVETNGPQLAGEAMPQP